MYMYSYLCLSIVRNEAPVSHMLTFNKKKNFFFLTFFSSFVFLLKLKTTNFIETRTDGYKLLNDFRRVVPNRVDGIGEALNVFYYVLYISIPVNAGLFVYTFDAGRLSPPNKVWIFVSIVFGLVFMLTLLDILFPDVPEKVSARIYIYIYI
jgi:hypothetical protein